MELKTYLTILWRHKWVIIITAIVTVVTVAFGTSLMTPKYVASATVRITPSVNGAGGGLDWSGMQYTDRLLNTYSQTVISGPSLEELMRQLNLDKPPHIEVEIPANTELMSIMVEDPNRFLTAEAANLLAEILIEQNRRSKAGRYYPVSLVDPAVVPEAPT